MSMGAGTPGFRGLLKDGYKHMSGLEAAVLKNVEACRQLSNMTRTSLGPNGMNKLVVNHLGKLFVTSDAATILRELEVEHPAAKMLVMASEMQEKEVGDATNFCCTFAGELLSQAENLLKMGIHPSEVVLGYKHATEKVQELLPSLSCYTVTDPRDMTQMTTALKSVIAAKQFGYEDLLAPIVARACVNVMAPAPKRAFVNVDNVRVCKIVGGSIGDCNVVSGVVVQKSVEGSVERAETAKIAVFGCAMEAASTETKGTVVIKSADELKMFNKKEEALMEEAIKGIADAGAKVVVVGGSISEVAQHYLNKYDLLTVKIISKFELRRLCRSIGATAMVRVGPPTADEMGYADLVSVKEISSRKVTVFELFDYESAISTIVVRGSTMNILDDIERCVDDAVNTAKVLCRDGRMLPGAGAVELELAHRIQEFGDATPGLEQYAIKKFAEALEVIPRTLAENSGQNVTDVISALYAAHAGGSPTVGVDVSGGATLNAAEAEIYDALTVKASAISLSTDAALTVLKVDQIIMAKRAGGPAPRAPGAPDA